MILMVSQENDDETKIPFTLRNINCHLVGLYHPNLSKARGVVFLRV
jgi:hypothetical protein